MSQLLPFLRILLPFLRIVFLLTMIDNSKDCTDNEGRDFIVIFPKNWSNDLDGLYIFITTRSVSPVSVRCFTPQPYMNVSIDVAIEVQSTQVQSIEIPWEFQLESTEIVNKSIRIISNQDIIVYAENSKEFSGDMYLVYPTNRLGANYIVVSHQSDVNTNSYVPFVAVASIADDTTVIFDFKVTLSIQFANGSTITGESITLMLHKYEVVQLLHHDLCGTIITSSQDIVAVSGNTFFHDQSFFGKSTGDHLLEQLFPVKYMSTEYIVIPSSTDIQSIEIVRIYSTERHTSITRETSVSNTSFFLENPGDSADFVLELISPSIIRADKIVSVVQIGIAGNSNGDQYMLMTSPVSGFMSSYNILVPFGYKHSDFTSGLVLIANGMAISSAYLDSVLIQQSDWNPIGQYFYINMPMSNGNHSVHTTAVEGVLGGFIYGRRLNTAHASSIGRSFYEEYNSQGNITLRDVETGKIIVDKFQRIGTEEIPDDIPLQTVFSSTLLGCSSQCLGRSNCAYFTYQKSMKTCETFSLKLLKVLFFCSIPL